MKILKLDELYFNGTLGYLLEKKRKAELRAERKSKKEAKAAEEEIKTPPATLHRGGGIC